jgi:UDP-glucose 4-epimerase
MSETPPAVLVTGGAGYIGSHVAWALREAGHPVAILDDLSTGRRDAVPPDAAFVEGNVADARLVGDVLRRFRPQAVLHFAGSIVVPDSVARPLDYYANNTVASHALISAAVAAGVRGFVFSSTATVYGDAGTGPLGEDLPPAPVHPYAASKAMTERMLADASRAHGLSVAVLRYFNVAGADPAGRTGQSTPTATHLIKVAAQVAVGLRPHLDVYGDDYPTPDGTCVRDYIHVSDLADAHVLALGHLLGGGGSVTLNCGYGRGHSVLEVLAAVERVLGRPLPTRRASRRAGDVAILVADPARIGRVLGWAPRLGGLDGIVESAIAWERRLRAG